MVKYTIENSNNQSYGSSSCNMDIATWVVIIILVLSIIYYLMNMFGHKMGNNKTSWLVIIALVASAIYVGSLGDY